MTRYLSVCSGIEAASIAWQSLGWQPVAFAEIEPFPCAVLAHHYPDVPNLGDMTAINGSNYRGTVDLIASGTPCQSFSVAGKRGGISDPRGALALALVRLVRDVSPRWIIWENVPGVFSSGEGADFKAFATALVQCGYHVAWRVLDAQYFGVPQRRRRVYLVGHFGDWRPAAAVLFEPHSLRGHSAPRKKKAQNLAGTVDASLGRNRGAGTPPGVITQALTGRIGTGPDDNKAQGGFYLPEIVSQAMSCKWAKGTSGPAGDEHHNLIATSQYGEIAGALTSRNDGSPCHDRGPTIVAFRDDVTPKWSNDDTALTLTTPSPSGGGHPQCIAIHPHCIGRSPSAGPQGKEYLADGSAYTLDGRGASQRVASTSSEASHKQVRRLTPLECERLQGFPDHYTAIIHRGKPAADGPRYKALGNSMAVPVMRWIGERIAAVGERSRVVEERTNQPKRLLS